MRILTMKTALILACLILSLASVAAANCPKGSWPRSMYSGPGGGLYTGPGGGMYTGYIPARAVVCIRARVADFLKAPAVGLVLHLVAGYLPGRAAGSVLLLVEDYSQDLAVACIQDQAYFAADSLPGPFLWRISQTMALKTKLN